MQRQGHDHHSRATEKRGISKTQRWVNVFVLVVAVACVPFSAGFYFLAPLTGPLHVAETCERRLREPMVRFDEQLFPLIRKTCIGESRRVQVVSPTVALPAAATLSVGVGGALYLWRTCRRQQCG
ncbi:hypothetical protein [Kineococcus auxinigenes]|uniref:hypothetical protein n=1 Tax=unclassified Kineococcus TaxID=2621656 RepID=UPI003D7CFC73